MPNRNGRGLEGLDNVWLELPTVDDARQRDETGTELEQMQFLEFSIDGRSYRADVRQAPGAPVDHPRKAWFVAVDGAREVRAFEAHWRDLDTRQFRRRLVAAAHRWANTSVWSSAADEAARGD